MTSKEVIFYFKSDMSLRFQPRNNNSTTTNVSTRLHEVLVIGEQFKARQLQRRCADVSKGFANANDLNDFSVQNSNGVSKDTMVPNDQKCAICLTHLIDRSDDGLYALEALYEPIQEAAASEAKDNKRKIDETLRVYNGCGHVFHRSCLRKWINKKLDSSPLSRPTCPICRREIDDAIVEDLESNEYFVKYDEDGRIVQKELPTSVVFYQGEKGEESKVRVEYSDGENGNKHIEYFEGERDTEKLVKAEFLAGKDDDVPYFVIDGRNVKEIQYFEGVKDQDKLVRIEFPADKGDDVLYFEIDGRKVKEIQYFEGEKYKEKLVRIEFPADKDDDVPYFEIDGRKVNEIQYFEGEKGKERKVKVTFADGVKYLFQGEKDNERKVEIKYTDGITSFFEGEKGNESIVKFILQDGTKYFFKGEQGKERKVEAEFADGAKSCFEGEKDNERIVECILRDGTKYLYKGEKGEERKVQSELINGTKRFFKGEKGKERKVKIVFANGSKHIFEGEKDNEHLVQIELKKFIHEFTGEKGKERHTHTVSKPCVQPNLCEVDSSDNDSDS